MGLDWLSFLFLKYDRIFMECLIGIILYLSWLYIYVPVQNQEIKEIITSIFIIFTWP